MNAQWIKSPEARRILVHWADARPAWLWSQDGTTLLWRNGAARYFNGRMKKHGVRLAPEAVPIKGQVTRLIRLGSPGRSSLSRVQFLAGERPVSTTCTCTPLELESGQPALLLVGVDAIDNELLDAPSHLSFDSLGDELFPRHADYLLLDADGQVQGGSPRGRSHYAPLLKTEGMPDLGASDSAKVTLGGEEVSVTRLRAGPQGATLVLFESEHFVPSPAPSIQKVRADEGDVERDAEEDTELALGDAASEADEPLLPIGLPEVPAIAPDRVAPAEDWVEPFMPGDDTARSLSSLFDRLADDAGLYAQLTDADEVFVAPRQEGERGETGAPDMIASLIEFADDPEGPEARGPETGQRPLSWRVIGRGFGPLAPADALTQAPEGVSTIDAAPDNETAERVSRYNFDELSRILTDSVGSDAPRTGEAPIGVEPPIAPVFHSAPPLADGVIPLSGETLVLNRLPLGILVFREQQVLFANRALTDLTGHDSVEGLRSGGIAAIFPPADGASAGPVTHLVRRDRTSLPVTARLQTITWQGRPALMLCASPAETYASHEAAVETFAQLLAEVRNEGFVLADRSGIITQASASLRGMFVRDDIDLVGRPLAGLVAPGDLEALKAFLERPARFAETARPSVLLSGRAPDSEIVLFAEGQAGIVTGYFALVRRRGADAPVETQPQEADVEPSVLARLSRSVRRPLNTIIGFADLIRSAAFGTIENQRYVEYARDIKTAGNEIALLVDELDDFTRLKDGLYAARPADLDLSALLESCVVRVKGQAGAARVLVRSAISERLPRIRADRASLGQAILNLLASAIDQTPVGGSVILSAQAADDGGIAIHIRDGSASNTDIGERFVVFRDGLGRDGEALMPVRSSVGLALTRSLLAVNTCSLSVDPSGGVGTLFSLAIPVDLVVAQ